MGVIIEEMVFLLIKSDNFVKEISLISVQWIFGIILLGLSWIRNGVFCLFFFFWFFFWFLSISHKNKFWVSLTMLLTHHGAPLGDMPRGKPIPLEISMLLSILLVIGYTGFLGFHSQGNYSSGEKKGYESFLTMIDPTAITLSFRFQQKSERGLTWPSNWSDQAFPTNRLVQ